MRTKLATESNHLPRQSRARIAPSVFRSKRSEPGGGVLLEDWPSPLKWRVQLMQVAAAVARVLVVSEREKDKPRRFL